MPSTQSLRLTFPGRVVAAVAALSTLAAAALGGAALLLPALACAALLASAAGGWLALRRLEPAAPTPRRAFAGDAFDVELVLANRSSLWRARDVVLAHGQRGPDKLRPAAFVPSLEPRAARRVVAPHRIVERGRHRRYWASLSSSFPLGLVEHGRTFELAADFLVLPRLGTLRNLAERLAQRRGHSAATRRAHIGDEEFYGLHEWRPGESQHLVHWKISARQGKAIVRELAAQDRAPVHLVLQTALARMTGRRLRAFEEAVCLCATLAEQLLRERHRLRLTLAGARGATLRIPSGRAGLFAALDLLAEVAPELETAPVTASASTGATARAAARSGELTVVVLASGGWRRRVEARADALVLDVDDAAIERVFSRTRAALLPLWRG